MTAGPESGSPTRRFSRLAHLDRTVRALGFVSFLADVSSEAIYPLFPLFVTSVLGAPAALLGFIEGIAEATASITKWPFGQASDHTGRRRPFVGAGYGAAALGKLILALSYAWPVALLGRFVDRFGKGVRTAPRDALIAAVVPGDQRGLAFGLHRAMDTLGAVVGPLAALLLYRAGFSIRTIFAFAVLPGIASVVVIFLFVRERTQAPARASFRPYLPPSPAYRWLLASALLFGVGNSSDVFILLRASNVLHGTHSTGMAVVTDVILLYVLYNVTYAAGSLRSAASATASARCRSSSGGTSSSRRSTWVSRQWGRGRRWWRSSRYTASTSPPRTAPARRSSAAPCLRSGAAAPSACSP